jgi:hypothetical protein
MEFWQLCHLANYHFSNEFRISRIRFCVSCAKHSSLFGKHWTRLLCFGRGEAPSSRQDWLLLGKQIAKDILSPLPELEALVRI